MPVYVLFEKGREWQVSLAFRAENRKAAENHVMRLNRQRPTRIMAAEAAVKRDINAHWAISDLTRAEWAGPDQAGPSGPGQTGPG